jgi:hypothetical protein
MLSVEYNHKAQDAPHGLHLQLIKIPPIYAVPVLIAITPSLSIKKF